MKNPAKEAYGLKFNTVMNGFKFGMADVIMNSIE